MKMWVFFARHLAKTSLKDFHTKYIVKSRFQMPNVSEMEWNWFTWLSLSSSVLHLGNMPKMYFEISNLKQMHNHMRKWTTTSYNVLSFYRQTRYTAE